MEHTTHYEEHTKVVEPMGTNTMVTTDKKHKNKHKKNKKVKDQYGTKKSVGTKIKEFFTGRKDDGIIYQDGLPIAGLNGPVVQPMGAPIRQPAEFHPVATVNTTPMTVAHAPGEVIHGPTTTTYGPAPPLGPGFEEGYSRTTTHTDVVRPGLDVVQPMNAVAQPTGLGAIVQPAGVIIAKKDKRLGLQEGYLKDQTIHAYPHDRVKDKALVNPHKHAKHDKHDKHVHEEHHVADYMVPPAPIVEPMYPVNTVPAEPAPAIFTGPARALDNRKAEKEIRKEEKLAEKEYRKEQKLAEKEHRKEEKLAEKELKHDKHHHTNIDQQAMRPNAYYQPTVLEQQPLPVTVMGPGQPGYVAPTGGFQQQQQFIPPQQPIIHQDRHLHEKELKHESIHHTDRIPSTVVEQPGAILQQPGLAPSIQPVVRNHQQVPMTSQSGLQQGGIFQNDTARPVQTFTPVIQPTMPITEAPILNQAAMEQASFAPAGIRTKEGLVETRLPAGHATKNVHPAGYEERKETVVHQDVKY